MVLAVLYDVTYSVNNKREKLMTMPEKTLPELIKTRRRVLKYTLQELGQMCGVTHAAVAHWEDGRRTPGANVLWDLIKSLELTDRQIKLMLKRLSQ